MRLYLVFLNSTDIRFRDCGYIFSVMVDEQRTYFLFEHGQTLSMTNHLTFYKKKTMTNYSVDNYGHRLTLTLYCSDPRPHVSYSTNRTRLKDPRWYI